MNRLRRSRPDFLVIGAMKSGTTSLYSDLSKAGDIYLPAVKEPWILAKDVPVDEHQNLYRRLFKAAPEGAICGDPSTGYALRPRIEGVASRASTLCGPELKIIYIMREPVSRAISHVRHDVMTGRLPAIQASKALMTDPFYTDVSNYPYQLEPWLEQFGRANVYVVNFEQYIDNRAVIVSRVLEFLEAVGTLEAQQLVEVKNRSVELVTLDGFFGNVANSQFYRLRIKPLVPHWLREIAKQAVRNRSVAIEDIEISAEAIEFLSDQLSSVITDTEKLLGDARFADDKSTCQRSSS